MINKRQERKLLDTKKMREGAKRINYKRYYYIIPQNNSIQFNITLYFNIRFFESIQTYFEKSIKLFVKDVIKAKTYHFEKFVCKYRNTSFRSNTKKKPDTIKIVL